MDENMMSFELPGFRFKPTEEELLSFYLKNIVHEKKMHLDIIGFLNIYRYDPSDLPGLAKIGEREWYFFVPRDRKPNNGGKPNRTTEHGFWKATGSDRKIVSLLQPRRVIGLRKTLVFYKGRAPRGSKTDWVMNEYRLPDNCATHKDIVLCKVYRKATSLKELEQRAAKEEAILEKSSIIIPSYPTSPISSSNGTTSYSGDDFGQLEDFLLPPMFMCKNDHNTTNLKREEVFFNVNGTTFEPRSFISDTSFLTSTPESEEKFEEISMSSDKKKEGFFDTFESRTIIPNTSFLTSTLETEKFEDIAMSSNNSCNVGVSNTVQLPFGKGVLGALQVPKLGLDWAQDPFSSQSCSPWLENLLINFSSPTLISQVL